MRKRPEPAPPLRITHYSVILWPGSRRAPLDRSPVASASADRYLVGIEQAAFGPCVTNPEKILCIGLNYRRHAAETNNPVPKQPILFNKYNTALNCCGGEIAVSKEKAVKFDYEAELVIVLGRTARNVAEADALGYIFGYCTGNDLPRAICSRCRASGC